MKRLSYPMAVLGAFVAILAGSVSAAPAPKVTWHHVCVGKFSFCADFPYVTGAQYGFESRVYNLPLGTAANGKEPDWISSIYRNPKSGRFCTKLLSVNCPQQEFYSVSVFKSKFSDPWTALTAINGGVKDPVRTTFDGNLAAKFKDLYGYIGYTVYHRGQVYYINVGIFTGKATPAFADRFFRSIKLQ